MKIALHAGLACTEEDRLLKSFLRNAELLRSQLVSLPDPDSYRGPLTQIFDELGAKAAIPEAGSVFLDGILADSPKQIRRLVFSHDSFFAKPRDMFAGGVLCPEAELRAKTFRAMMAGHDVEIFLALRNPVTWLPELLKRTPHASVEDLMQGLDVGALRWFPLIERLQAALPGTPITVWAYEDLPFILGEVISTLCALPTGSRINGEHAMLADIMMPEGMRRFRAYLMQNPLLTEPAKRKVMMAFLDKYADPTQMEDELDVPGWTDAFVEAVTDAYEADLDFIATLPGIKFIET